LCHTVWWVLCATPSDGKHAGANGASQPPSLWLISIPPICMCAFHRRPWLAVRPTALCPATTRVAEKSRGEMHSPGTNQVSDESRPLTVCARIYAHCFPRRRDERRFPRNTHGVKRLSFQSASGSACLRACLLACDVERRKPCGPAQRQKGGCFPVETPVSPCRRVASPLTVGWIPPYVGTKMRDRTKRICRFAAGSTEEALCLSLPRQAVDGVYGRSRGNEACFLPGWPWLLAAAMAGGRRVTRLLGGCVSGDVATGDWHRRSHRYAGSGARPSR